MNILRKTGIVGGVLALLALVGAVVVYAVFVPRVVAKYYEQNVISQKQALSTAFNKVAATADAKIFTEYDGALSAKQGDLRKVEAAIKDGDTAVNNYAKVSHSLLTLMFAESISSDYRKANVSKERSRQIVAQSKDVLSGYRQLVRYAAEVVVTQQLLEKELATVNAVTNFDEFAGRSTEFATTASVLMRAKQQIENQSSHLGDVAVHSQFIALLSLTADGMNEIAKGVDMAVDAHISSGVGKIEDATKQYDSGLKSGLFSVLSQAPILAQVRDLPDKIDSLLY